MTITEEINGSMTWELTPKSRGEQLQTTDIQIDGNIYALAMQNSGNFRSCSEEEMHKLLELGRGLVDRTQDLTTKPRLTITGRKFRDGNERYGLNLSYEVKE